jgi:hypothetical protein
VGSWNKKEKKSTIRHGNSQQVGHFGRCIGTDDAWASICQGACLILRCFYACIALICFTQGARGLGFFIRRDRSGTQGSFV